MLHMNRCKTCIFWQQKNNKLAGQFRAGTPEKSAKTCHARTIDRVSAPDADGKTKTVEVRTWRTDDKTTPGPKYGKRTSKNDSCRLFVSKVKTVVKPKPQVEESFQPMGEDDEGVDEVALELEPAE